jgi:tetratricopeptide (TPR) repeat protein
MRIFLYILSIITSALWAEEKSTYLWDLGVKIDDKAMHQQKSVEDNANSNKHASLSNQTIKPQKIKAELKPTSILPIESHVEKLSNLDKLKYGEQHFFLGQYLSTIKYLENIDFETMDENEKKQLIYLYSDALYSLGKYQRVVGILSDTLELTKTDEMLFLLGMSSLKCNDKKNAVNTFDELVKNYPESEYSFLANLQSRAIKRR